MEKKGLQIPLLIGGATTSRIHTAVKIDPKYSNNVTHVLDASKSVTVASQLLSASSEEFRLKIKQEYKDLAEGHKSRKSSKEFVSYADAVNNKFKVDWSNSSPPKPTYIGIREYIDYDLAEIRKLIDWTPFFSTWMLKGKYPKIFENEVIGEEAKKLYEDANELLDQILAEKSLQANAVVGFFPANEENGDIILSGDYKGNAIHQLRQQGKKGAGISNISLSDFVAPIDSGKQDYIGAFAVTAGIGIEKLIENFEKDHDDYQVILVKAIADRLAEAFAELMHAKVRRDYWGYATDEQLSNEELIKESYQGIRPAPGYPACPDHTEKAIIWDLLEAEKRTGISLTESYAMYPASSVSGLYFSHPDSKYFGLGKIYEDQIKSYSERKEMPREKVEKWLAPNLGYK